MVRIIVIDHQDIPCESLAARLGMESDLEVLATCFSGNEALVRARALRPQVAVIDYGLAGPCGCLSTLMQLRRTVPECRAVVLSEFRDGDVILRCFRAGAASYVLKDSSVRALADCLRAVHAGQSPLDPVVGQLLVEEIARQESEQPLTPAELQVLSLVTDGLTNRQIGRLLHAGESTIKRHLSAVYEKLGVEKRHEAAQWARERGLV